jgi:hypothetical protein
MERDPETLLREVAALRDTVQRLRQSRRILLWLLAHELGDRQALMAALERENRRLRRRQSRLVRVAWQRAAGQAENAKPDRTSYP